MLPSVPRGAKPTIETSCHNTNRTNSNFRLLRDIFAVLFSVPNKQREPTGYVTMCNSMQEILHDNLA